MEVSPEQIRNEHIRLLYKQAPLILIGSFLAVGVVTVVEKHLDLDVLLQRFEKN